MLVATLCSAFTGTVWGADVTIEKTMSEIATANNWTTASGNGTQTCYTSFNLDTNITISTSGSANCGSFWGSDWRLYQAQSGDVTITGGSGVTLKSVTFTYSVNNNGTLKDGSTTVASNSAQTLSGTSKTYTVGNTGDKTNGQVRITKISVTYEVSGDTPTPTNPTVSFGTHDNINLAMWDEDLKDLASGDGVAEGTLVYVTATPAFGYNFASISAVDANNTTVTLTENSGNWSFAMPNSNVTINATAMVDNNVITLWSENFSSYSADDVPSGGTYSYACTSSTKIYDAVLAGGTTPELLVAKNGGTFTAVISLNNASGTLQLTYKTNAKAMSVSTTTENISGGGSFNTSGEHTVTFTGVTTSMTSITIVFTATSSDNVRLDDIELRGHAEPVSVEAPTFSVNGGTYYTAQSVELSCATDGATIYYTTNGDKPTASSTEYTGAIAVNETMTIKAIAIKGSDQSTVSSSTYTITEKNDVVFNITDKTLAYGEEYTITRGTYNDRDIQSDGTITVSSDNPVVSINNLKITANAVGVATITLSVAEGDTYKEGSTTITLTVTAPEALNTAKPNTTATIFEEHFTNAAGSGPVEGNDWTGNIAGAAWTADKDGWSYPYNSNNNAQAYAGNGCARIGSGSVNGWAETPAISFDNNTTYTLTFKAGAWKNDGTTLTVSCDDADAVIGTTEFTMVHSEWSNYSTTIKAQSGSKIKFATSNGRFFLDDVVVNDPNASSTVSVTIAASGYGTYCCQYPLNLPADNADYKAYVVSNVETVNNTPKVTFTKISGDITGGIPFILYGTQGSYELTSVSSSATLETTNMLQGTLAPTYLVPETTEVINFIMSGGQFKMINAAGNLAANKAYLPVQKSVLPTGFGQGGNTARLTIVFEDETTTTIQGVTTQKETDAIYNLKGQRVDNPVKGGLYIVNGKKVVK